MFILWECWFKRLTIGMFYMSIWNSNGVIPPIRSEEPTSLLRSPYDISLEQLIHFFAISTKRCQILAGFLNHRAQLHQLGIRTGFQWINGSFSEHVELREQRDPNDIDVVAFIDISNEQVGKLTDEQLQLLIDKDHIKNIYSVDFFTQSLQDVPEDIVKMTSYWYSMWAHDRSYNWKGFLSVTLDPSGDSKAKELLDRRLLEIGHGQD